MELNLKLEIQNLFGGDGVKRFIDVEETKFTRTKKKTTTKQDIGVPVDRATDEVQTEMVKKEVQTFAMDGKYPTMRLGGIHGKFWGHLRASGKMLADLKDEEFPSKAFVDRIMMAVNMNPMNVVIEKFDEIKIAEIPQITQGMNKAMIIQKFDYIPKCTVDLTLVYPEVYHSKVLKILKHAETMAGLNKRRATMKILNREIFE
ncbi:unnamed protein product [marine sediment metagenome]|uniref:Uncharacterized protein n=1 Tax=marine sediment metagenome TaxID=412755 RepID=X1B0B5_9ZZZZ